MADQVLDFRYRVSGQDLVLKSLENIEKALDRAAAGYARLAAAAQHAGSIHPHIPPVPPVPPGPPVPPVPGGGPGPLGGPTISNVQNNLHQIINLHQITNNNIVNNARNANRAQQSLLGSLLSYVRSVFSSIGNVAIGAFSLVFNTARRIASSVVDLAGKGVGLAFKGVALIADGAKSVADTVFGVVKRAFDLATQVAGVAGVLSIAGAGAAAVALGKSSIEADQHLRGLTSTLQVASGSAQGAKDNLKFLRDEANKLGLAVGDLDDTYASFANGIVASGGTIKQAQSLFRGFATYAKATGQDAFRVQLALTGLTQALGKGGNLQQEDFKGQILENLPGIGRSIADSLGVTTAQLNQMVTTGVSAQKVFANVGDYLANKFGPQAEESAKGLGKARAVFSNEFLQLRQNIGEGLNSPLAKILTDINGFLGKLANSNFGQRVGAIVGNGLLKAYREIKKTASDLEVVYVFIQRGFAGLSAYLGEKKIANPYDRFTGGIILANKALVNLGPAARLVLDYQGRIVQFFHLAVAAVHTLEFAAITAAKALRDVYAGISGGDSAASGALGTLRSVLQLINGITIAVAGFAADGGFVRIGEAARDGFEKVRAAIYSLNGATGIVDFALKAVKSLKELITQVGYVKDTIVYAGFAIFRAFVILAPALKPLTDRLGLIVPKVHSIRDAADLVAAPFLTIGDTLNQLADSGAIDRFAKKLEGGIERALKAADTLKTFFRGIVTISEDLFAGSSTDDLKVDVETKFPGMPSLVKAANFIGKTRDAMVELGNVVGAVIDTVDDFWKKWGGTIKTVYGYIVTAASALANFFGVKGGEQVLILLFLGSLIARFSLLGTLISGLAGAVLPAFAALATAIGSAITGLLTGLLGLIGGVLAGPLGLAALVTAAVIGAVALIYTHFDGVKGFFADLPKNLADGFDSAISSIGDKFDSLGERIRKAVIGFDPTEPFKDLDKIPKEGPLAKTPDVSDFDKVAKKTSDDATADQFLKDFAKNNPANAFAQLAASRPSLPVQLAAPSGYLTEPSFVAAQRQRDQAGDASRNSGVDDLRRQNQAAQSNVTIVDEDGRNKYGTTFQSNLSPDDLLASMRAARVGQPRSAPIAMRPGA